MLHSEQIDFLSVKEFLGRSRRSFIKIIFEFGLKSFYKIFIGIICHDGQHIERMNVKIWDGRIHTFTSAVDAKAKSAPNLLPSLYVGIAVFQRANLEYVGVIPPFTKRRMRENKPCRLFKGK